MKSAAPGCIISKFMFEVITPPPGPVVETISKLSICAPVTPVCASITVSDGFAINEFCR